MLDLEDSIWVGTDGGLASINKSNLSVRYYNKLNSGLPDCRVNALIRTKSDILLGTDCGLVEYQNGTWVTYTTQNSILSTNKVTAFHYSNQLSTTWMGLDDGNVIKIETVGWNFCLGTNILKPASRITRIVLDSANIIWVGTTSNYIYKFDGLDWFNYNSLAGWISGNFPITDLVIDQNGSLYACLATACFKHTANNWVWVMVSTPTSTPIYPTKVTVDNTNKFWFSNRYYGFQSWDGSVLDDLPAINANLTSQDLTYHFIDNQHLWTGNYLNGVDQVNGINVTNIPLVKDISVNTIKDINFDSTGTAWIALYSRNKAFCSFDGNTWTDYSTLNTNLHTNKVYCLTIDSNSVKWLAPIGSGLFSDSCGNSNEYDTLNSNIISDYISTVATDYNNNILIGTWDGYVQLFSNNTFTMMTDYVATSNLTNFKRIIKITPENANRFWIATDSSGLIRCDYSNIIVYDTSNSGIPCNRVEDVKVDAAHNAWVATGAGIAKFDGTLWTIYDSINSPLPENHITSIAIGHDSSIWVGTLKSGLLRYKSQSWSLFNKCESPLVSNEITTLKTAPNGEIYIGTKDGLSIIDVDNATGETIFRNQSKAKIYPNPATEYVQFDFCFQNSHASTLRVFNHLGQPILNKEIQGVNYGKYAFRWDINKSLVTPGIYFYILEGNNEILTGKIIIIKN